MFLQIKSKISPKEASVVSTNLHLEQRSEGGPARRIMDARSLKRRLGVAEETIAVKWSKRRGSEEAEEVYEEEHRTFTTFSKQLEEKWEQRFDAIAALAANAKKR